MLSSTGHIALFPLLYLIELTALKLSMWITYLVMLVFLLQEQFKCINLRDYEIAYIGVLPVITLYETTIHDLIFKDKLPFLPLALTSIYCAIGVVYSYVIYYYEYLSDAKKLSNKRRKGDNHNTSKID